MYVAKQCKESTSRILQQPDGKKAQQFRMRDNRERRSQAEFMQKLHPIQCTTYIRGIIEEEKINADIDRLNKEPEEPKSDGPDGGYDKHVSEYLGGAILSASRYNEGQKQYYAPVGYVIEISEANDSVLCNFKGDGNTDNPNIVVFERWYDEQTDKDQYKYKEEKGEQRQNTVKKLLKLYFKRTGNKDLLVENEEDLKRVEDELKVNASVPVGSKEVQYTESVIHINGLEQISGAYYNLNHTGSKPWNYSLEEDAKSINGCLEKTTLFEIDGEGKLVKTPSDF